MDPLPNKSRLLILAAVVAGTAVLAIPRLSGSTGPFVFKDSGAADVGAAPLDDGFFANGFDAPAARSGSSTQTDSSGKEPSTSGLAASLESALARLERVGIVELAGHARVTGTTAHELGSAPPSDEDAHTPRPTVSPSAATPESTAGSRPSSSESSVAPEPDPRIDERLRLARWLEKSPLRGSIVGSSGATLLVDGRRLAVGDGLGVGAWLVARIEATTVEFRSGALRVRVGLRDRRASSTGGAVPAPSLPTEVHEEGP